MKENKYDDAVFFEKYSEMNRSKFGLKGSGEWSELKKLLPDFNGKRVLDLGCGFGWHCKYAVENGAKKVLGIDISKKMLDEALLKNKDEAIEYRCEPIEDLLLDNNSFDVVLSSLTFHYIKDFASIVSNISKWVCAGGKFVFSVEHPVFTSEGSQSWFYDENGVIKHFPVDNYYFEGAREAVFLGEKVTKYHKTLTTYLNTLLNNGFIIDHIVEPMPPKDMMDIPGMADEMRRPMMLLVSCTRK